ncbi:MAG: hypothetical protein SX243_03815 [Acidobacteriota bacterium]|nr:hypothetical protein [Acidobacteriota bacterium]
MLYRRPWASKVSSPSFTVLNLAAVLAVVLTASWAVPAFGDVVQHQVIQVTTGLDNPNGTTVDTAVPKKTENVTSSISSKVVGGVVFDNEESTLTVFGNKLGHATVTLRWTDSRGQQHEQDFSVSVVKGRND